MKATVQSRSSARSSLLWIALGVLGTSVLGLAQPALAQPTSADLQTPVGSSDRDANGNGDLSNIDTMFDLLHRAQMGSIRDPYEFNRDQQQNINTAASTFRQRQLELLRQQGQPGTSSATPSATQTVSPGSTAPGSTGN